MVKNPSVRRWLLFLVLSVTAALTVFRYRSELTVENVESWVNGFDIWGPVVFVAAFIAATVLFLPGSIFALAGGALFGPVWGTLYNLVAATAGATAAFYIARYLASDWIIERAGGKLKEILRGVNDAGWRFVAFVRLVPLFPFNLLNYTLGLSRIESRDYILASLICMSPGAVAYTYLGYLGREVVGGGENLVSKGLLALSLLVALTLLPGLVRLFFPDLNSRFGRTKAKMISTDELYQWTNDGSPIKLIDVRTEREFNGPLGHISGARSIPLTQLSRRLYELEEFRSKPMAVL